MKQLLVIPNREKITDYLALVQEYGVGFEYNDFMLPSVLDDGTRLQEIVDTYKQQLLPSYTTIHGAFYDVIPFSVDERIREISMLRIEQSVEAAKKIGAKAVVFHTNYNSCLNSREYVENWLKDNSAYWAQVLERHKDICIYLENTFESTPDILEALSQRLCVYSNYGVCLDYAHASLSKVEPSLWAQKLGRFVKHIHINDNDGVSDLHLAWGDGVINRSQFYEDYERYMKEATVLVETSSLENTLKSFAKLKEEGFLETN